MADQTFETDISRLISESKTELSGIQDELKELVAKEQSLLKEIESYEITLNGYQKRIRKQLPNNGSHYTWLNELKELPNHRERIIAIAKKNGGKIKTTKVRNELYDAGLIKSKTRNNAYQIVNGQLLDMVEKGFAKKLDSGEYELIEKDNITNQELAPGSAAIVNKASPFANL